MRVFWGVFLAGMMVVFSAAAEWPQFRHDAARSGYASAGLGTDLSLKWTFVPPQPPDPAWRGEDTRQPYDYAYHPVVGGGLVYFGASADNRVYALDAESGAVAWTFDTDGPVRFAPVYDAGRLYVVSDDGHCYALDAANGRLLWRKRGGPTDDLLLGNGRMMARWPARGAVTLHGGVLYYGAGIWPSEGIYLYALDPETGAVRWCNDTSGYIEMPQPHPTAEAKSGVSAQGYLAIGDNTLLVPTGRANPAAFDLDTGAFRYFRLQEYNARGAGPFVTTDGNVMFARNDAFSIQDGTLLSSGLVSDRMAVFPKHIVYATGNEVRAVPRSPLFETVQTLDRKGKETTKRVPSAPVWTVPWEGGAATALIGAGDTVVLGGADDRVRLLSVNAPGVRATFSTRGTPLSLAVSEGALFVGTDTGNIQCFAPGVVTAKETGAAKTGARELPPSVKTLAKDLVDAVAVDRGYCLLVDMENADLALALAEASAFNVYLVADDAATAQRLRDAIPRDLYGRRITVLARPYDRTGLPDYFANLVYTSEVVMDTAAARAEAERCLRPYGGGIYTSRHATVQGWKRGPLEGAGEWTHEYADAGNSLCSDDSLLRGPLGMLWFTDNDLEMPSRHGRGPAPLFWDGRIFVEGLNGLRALDAYNGTVLWNFPLPGILKAYDQEHLNGTAITGSNFCMADGVIYLRRDDRCLRIDARTGTLLREITAPPRPDGAPGRWGYIACDGNTLFGSLYRESHTVTWAFLKSDMSQLFSESLLFFALDAKTGAVKWQFTPVHSIRNNAIAVGGGKVFLIDRPMATRDRRRGDDTPQPPGELVALDGDTGAEVWRAREDIFGTMLALSEKYGVLIMGYQATRFKLPSEVGGRLAAFDMTTGKRLWDVKANYASRPIINDRTVYVQGGAWDLLTAKPRPFPFSRSYGCGILAGSRDMLAFRSATLGYWDLTLNRMTENYGGIRPGCWINALPVGGLLLVPEASNRCRCSYLNKATFALEPRGIRAPIIAPQEGLSAKPITVALTAEGEETEIRYTLDGQSPSESSPRYQAPIPVTRTATLQARAFRSGQAPSPVATARYIIDPAALPLAGDAWRVIDAPGGTPATSKWVVENGVAAERSNLFKGDAANVDPQTERPGTLRVYQPGDAWTDGDLALEIASEDDDGLGMAFRVKDENHYYLWAMDQQRRFHILACKNGDDYHVLAVKKAGYPANTWQKVRIQLTGPEIVVYLDGQEDLRATDATFGQGTIALYAWGSTGAKFRGVKWKAR